MQHNQAGKTTCLTHTLNPCSVARAILQASAGPAGQLPRTWWPSVAPQHCAGSLHHLRLHVQQLLCNCALLLQLSLHEPSLRVNSQATWMAAASRTSTSLPAAAILSFPTALPGCTSQPETWCRFLMGRLPPDVFPAADPFSRRALSSTSPALPMCGCSCLPPPSADALRGH